MPDRETGCLLEDQKNIVEALVEFLESPCINLQRFDFLSYKFNLPVSITYPRVVVPLTFGTVGVIFLLWKMSQFRLSRGGWRVSDLCRFFGSRNESRLVGNMEKEEAGNAVPIDRFRAEEDAKEDALKQVEELDKENIGLHETIKQLDLQLQELIDAKDRLNQRLVEQEAATQSALERQKEEETAKQEALTRLSEQISLKLADNNPNIADLSDVNRPTNLSEKFSLLYDDEWTEAFDTLQETTEFQEEEKAIKQLLEMLMEQIPTEMKKLIKEKRKKYASIYLPCLYETVIGSLREQCEEVLDNNAVDVYIKRCTELCWLMVVQDPPMTILTDVGEDCKYDKSKFREYTKTGPFIDYIVWPAVLIQEGGNMMAKGVAQCRCRVAEVHDEYQRDRVETDEEKSTQEEKFVCDTDTSGKDFQTTPVNTDGVELQFEPNKSQEIAIQTTETENGLPVIDVNTENAKDESGNHGSDQTESVEQVGVASYTDDKKDSQFQLGEKQSEFLLSSNKGNHTIKDIKNKVNNSIPETNEASKNEDFNATQNDNEMHFTEKNSNTRDQVWKTNEAIGIDNKTSKTITESNVEQIATKICVDNERDNGEHQRHIAKIENIDTKEQDTITVEENDDKLSSGIRDGASCSPRDSNIAVTNQVLTTSNDPNQLDNESDSTSAKDINAEEATRIQMAHTVNIVEPGSIETANVTDDIVLPNATIESDKSLTKEETLNIVSAMTVDNQNGRIETNMNLNVDEDKQLVAESFVDSKAASNETNNNNITTASGIHTKEIVFCCSAEAKITSTKLDTTNDGNDLETESRDIANLYKKEENTEDEFKVDDANTCPDTPTRTNQEEEEDVDEQKMEEEQELHRNYSKNIESKTDVETIEGDAIEIDSKIPTTFES